ncbi:MAG: Hsp20/alpha crystallin family protein [Chitinophagales bacterium]|nr:Hsp20/alpha crystallin family protein [Chitinophagales bacterium]
MKISSGWKKLSRNASINSILGGGMSVPVIHLFKKSDHIEVNVLVPGIESSELFVEIQGNDVVVLRMLKLQHSIEESTEERLIVHSFPITRDIDFKNIHAFQEDEMLKIILPMEESRGDVKPNSKIEEN